jgi:hypothetical protein
MKTSADLRGCGPFAEATPAEVRAALIDEETGEFDRQWREALAAAAETLVLRDRADRMRLWPGRRGWRGLGFGRVWCCYEDFR